MRALLALGVTLALMLVAGTARAQVFDCADAYSYCYPGPWPTDEASWCAIEGWESSCLSDPNFPTAGYDISTYWPDIPDEDPDVQDPTCEDSEDPSTCQDNPTCPPPDGGDDGGGGGGGVGGGGDDGGGASDGGVADGGGGDGGSARDGGNGDGGGKGDGGGGGDGGSARDGGGGDGGAVADGGGGGGDGGLGDGGLGDGGSGDGGAIR